MAIASTSKGAASSTTKKDKVAIIGSGNWGSAVARLAGINVERHSTLFDPEVVMWTREEQHHGRNLTEIINTEHINKKYLPGIELPISVRAEPDLLKAVEGATALVFVVPHQFLNTVLDQIKGHIAEGAVAISCIKGVDVEDGVISIFADVIETALGTSCSALSGANIASEVAQGRFSETTVGYRHFKEGEMWQKLFQTKHFRVQLVDDVAGVSLCGALKNIVAVAAGFIDGLEWGNNSKAAIMRIGLLEIKQFCFEFFPGVKSNTFLQESAGFADIVTTCLGGRNRMCSEAYVRTGKSFDVIEKELLKGQKLQGIYTAREIHVFLKSRNRVEAYPLFQTVHEICWKGLEPKMITSRLYGA
ncbi:NAD-dependent glycerol-3-phosphate dehydrogenase N-terminus-domain-containing protein [Mrakia frigida]|uniref:glycerol-3-phosphate dehydrogenase family protein n=1 Tax=Mrakia frigida TaxID=29902 RepID=UPI003FCBF6CA